MKKACKDVCLTSNVVVASTTSLKIDENRNASTKKDGTESTKGLNDVEKKSYSMVVYFTWAKLVCKIAGN